MMDTIIKAPRRFSLYGAVLAMAALVITLLAVAYATGPAQAQNTGNTDDYTNLSTYPDPQPCGPGAGTAFMKEPHEITTGHYALFDAYWRTISEGSGATDGVGVLHTNLCPPEMGTTTTVDPSDGSKTVTTTRSPRNGGMDVDEAIMHVLDTHKADVVATNAEATGGQLSLEEYPGVGKGVDAGDSVWWLRLDDPATVDDPNTPEKENDETSDLGIGFSTLLLDKKHWLTRAEGKPMRYKFEVERHPDDPTDVPHFFAYEAPRRASETPSGEERAKLVWDSTKPDIDDDDMLLDPGEYKALQWVFTKPGTYLLWVHLQGDVRDEDNKPAGAGADWKPISGNETETSEVYRYTIQVGSELDEIEPPIFGVNLSVEENTPAGVKVGDPILVYNADAGTLYYDLTGPGHGNFKPVVASTDPHAVQIVVKEGASLDYDTMPPTESYELNLSVTDKVDHEDNFNPYPDDVLIVKIDLNAQDPGLKIRADRTSLKVGETVNFTVRYEQAPEHIGRKFGYQLEEYIGTSTDVDRHSLWRVVSSAPNASAPNWSVSIRQSSAVTKTYRATVVLPNDFPPPTYVDSDGIEITWGN